MSGTCGSRGLQRHLRPQVHPDQPQIDLTALSFCEPLGLVAIAALADQATAAGQVIFTAPENPSVARYLARMHLDRLLEELGVDHQLPAVHEQPRADVLVELTRIADAHDADRLAQMVHRVVEPADPTAASALYVGLTEIGNDVPRHAQRPYGFLAAQKTYQGRELLFAVADGGVGVYETLRRYGARDAQHALRLAVVEGATEIPNESSGGTLRDVAAELCRCGGYLHVVSGDASITVSQQVYLGGPARQALDGTAVQGAVRQRSTP